MKFYLVSAVRKGVYGLALLLIFTGCAYVREKLDTFRKADYYEHTVKWPGESLSVIAKWYTGNLENWKAIAQANPELDPKRITIGTKIRIPENLIKNKEPMPQDFVASSGREPEKAPSTAKPKPPPKAAYYEHTVQWEGESLSIIAKWYTGRFDNWRALAQANPDLDPKRITIGTKIGIPEDLLENREPMPKDFVASFSEKTEEAPPAPKPRPTEKAAYHVHTIQWPGESLSIIAKWYTGDPENWKALARTNPDVDPKRIKIGTKIRIPDHFLKNKEPMPKDFVASFSKKPEKAPPQHDPEALGQPEEEKAKLFGPKGYPGQ